MFVCFVLKHRGFLGNTLYDAIMVDMFSTPIECAPQRVNPNVGFGLWVIMMCQCKFIYCFECIALVYDSDNRGGYGYIRAGSIQELCTI